MVVIFVLIFNMAGCANVPLATMIEFADFNENDLLDIQSSDVRIKLRMEGGLIVDVDQTELTLDVNTEQGTRRYSFPLVKENSVTGETKASWFSDANVFNTTILKLSEQGIMDFDALQTSIASNAYSAQGNSFSVSAHFNAPEGEEEEIKKRDHILTIWLRLNSAEDYIKLIDDAELTLNW